MWLKKTLSGAGLIAGVVLILSGGVAQAQIKQLEVKPTVELKASEPKTYDTFEPRTLKVTEPATINSYETKSLEAGGFDREGYNPPKPEYPAYDRCAKEEGFDAQLKCAQETIGIAPE